METGGIDIYSFSTNSVQGMIIDKYSAKYSN